MEQLTFANIATYEKQINKMSKGLGLLCKHFSFIVTFSVTINWGKMELIGPPMIDSTRRWWCYGLPVKDTNCSFFNDDNNNK